MADENVTPEAVSPFAYKILPYASSAEGKTIEYTLLLENGVVFLYNDKTALIIATRYDSDTEQSNVDVIKEDEVLEYFDFKNLAKAGLLTHLYVIQTIGKEAGLNIVPAAEGDDTFRIDLTT